MNLLRGLGVTSLVDGTASKNTTLSKPVPSLSSNKTNSDSLPLISAYPLESNKKRNNKPKSQRKKKPKGKNDTTSDSTKANSPTNPGRESGNDKDDAGSGDDAQPELQPQPEPQSQPQPQFESLQTQEKQQEPQSQPQSQSQPQPQPQSQLRAGPPKNVSSGLKVLPSLSDCHLVIESTLVILPPANQWPQFVSIKKVHMNPKIKRPAYPHFTVMAPFVGRPDFDRARSALTALFDGRGIKPFTITLDGFEYFDQSRTMYLAPKTGGAEIRAIHSAVRSLVPQSTYKLDPHIGVGMFPNKQEAAKKKKEYEAGWTPLSWEVREVYMLNRSRPDSPWTICQAIPLAGVDPASSPAVRLNSVTDTITQLEFDWANTGKDSSKQAQWVTRYFSPAVRAVTPDLSPQEFDAVMSSLVPYAVGSARSGPRQICELLLDRAQLKTFVQKARG